MRCCCTRRREKAREQQPATSQRQAMKRRILGVRSQTRVGFRDKRRGKALHASTVPAGKRRERYQRRQARKADSTAQSGPMRNGEVQCGAHPPLRQGRLICQAIARMSGKLCLIRQNRTTRHVCANRPFLLTVLLSAGRFPMLSCTVGGIFPQRQRRPQRSDGFWLHRVIRAAPLPNSAVLDRPTGELVVAQHKTTRKTSKRRTVSKSTKKAAIPRRESQRRRAKSAEVEISRQRRGDDRSPS